MQYYKGESLTAEQQEKLFNNSITISNYKKVFDNKVLVDTAGFVPLEVRIKQMLLSGEMSKINSSMYDSDDWRYMYDNINQNALEVGDDIEDVASKLSLVMKRREEILQSKGLLNVVSESEESSEASEQKNEASDQTSESGAKAQDGKRLIFLRKLPPECERDNTFALIHNFHARLLKTAFSGVEIVEKCQVINIKRSELIFMTYI